MRTIKAWWRENRLEAPELFAHELAAGLEAIVNAPGAGSEFRVIRGIRVRRFLLPRSRYHVYYRHDATNDALEVLAVWHASRGSGPLLR
jgi:plasmid stabilization system protein ParE